MANETQGVQVPAVVAGTKVKMFTVKAANGSREFKATPLFPASKVVELGAEEGVVTFVDVNDKKQAARREKLLDPVGDKSPSRVHPEVLFFSEAAKKYGGIQACAGEGCTEISRKWTSDMHQSHFCLACGVKAKRSKSKAKRAAKASDK